MFPPVPKLLSCFSPPDLLLLLRLCLSREPQKSDFLVEFRTVAVLCCQFWHLWDIVRICSRWQRLWTQTLVQKFYLRAEFLFQLFYFLAVDLHFCLISFHSATFRLFQQLTAVKEDFSRQEKVLKHRKRATLFHTIRFTSGGMRSRDSVSAEGHERAVLRLHCGAACKGFSEDHL